MRPLQIMLRRLFVTHVVRLQLKIQLMAVFKRRTSLRNKFYQANSCPVILSGEYGVLQCVNPSAKKLMRDLSLVNFSKILPVDHHGLIQACLKTRETLTAKCKSADGDFAWSYQPDDEDDVVYICGYDAAKYKDEIKAIKALPKESPEESPNPVISYTLEGDLKFTNSVASKLLQGFYLKNIDDVLPHNHAGLLQACVTTRTPLTEGRDINGDTLIWTYKSSAHGKEIFIYGHDFHSLDSTMLSSAVIPSIYPGPVLSTDVDAVPRFINQSAYRIIQHLGLDKIEDILPSRHLGLVKACLKTNTPLIEKIYIGCRAIIWSYYPVEGSESVYIYGYDMSEYQCNNFSMAVYQV